VYASLEAEDVAALFNVYRKIHKEYVQA